MSGKLDFFYLTAYWSNDYSGAVIVSDIILDHKYWPESILFASNGRAKICVEDISSMDFVRIHSNTSQDYYSTVEGGKG